jgi:hypothetical protein
MVPALAASPGQKAHIDIFAQRFLQNPLEVRTVVQEHHLRLYRQLLQGPQACSGALAVDFIRSAHGALKQNGKGLRPGMNRASPPCELCRQHAFRFFEKLDP